MKGEKHNEKAWKDINGAENVSKTNLKNRETLVPANKPEEIVYDN